MHPVTPDGRYFVVKGQLWRCSNPSLDEEVRQRLVDTLMAARREVKNAKGPQDASQLKRAREKVQMAKVALGERGPVWWTDGSPDFNRRLVSNSPYAEWFSSLQKSEGLKESALVSDLRETGLTDDERVVREDEFLGDEPRVEPGPADLERLKD